MRAVLSIGSNMEDRRALLQTVFDEFADETIAASPVYATPPWGVTDQDEFLNAVLIVDVDCTPLELLRRYRKGDDQFLVSKTIQVTMNGLATALRNAG